MTDPLYEPNAGLLALAGLLLVGWYVILAVFAVIRWPKSPSAGPPTNDLRPEPPAVANLLTNGWLLTEDAMPATLLDLSTRGFVTIEDRGDGQIQCRLRVGMSGRGELQPYELRILEHLQRLATNGVVPAGALTTGPEEQSSRWWKSFRKEVGADAKARGVAREFWPLRLSALMLALGIPIFLLVQAAQGFKDAEEVHLTPLLAAVTYIMFGGLLPLGYLTGTSRQRDTPDGRVASAHWQGVRDNLETLPSFPELPPTAVITWERHLAYGAALGVAGNAVTTLPLGAENDKRAWTHYGGTWKQVRVQYSRFRPGWGTHPLLAVLISLARVALFGGILWIATSQDLLQASTYGADVPWWVTLVLAGVAIVFLVLLGWSAVGLVWAVLDVTGGKPVTGQVLRKRLRTRLSTWSEDSNKGCHVAVYTGTGDTVRAWRVATKKYPYFYQGQIVSVEVTPRLGYVRIPENT